MGWDEGGVGWEEESEGSWPVRRDKGGVERGEERCRRVGWRKEERVEHGEGGDVEDERVVRWTT